MKTRFRYSLKEMTVRLFALAKPIRFYLVISTLASIFGNLAHMGLMGFGALWILSAYEKNPSSLYMICTIISYLLKASECREIAYAVCEYILAFQSHASSHRCHVLLCNSSICELIRQLLPERL